MGSDQENSSSSGESGATSGGKAGWILLGVAALLAAGSVGYNVYEGGGSPDDIPEQAELPPSIEELRSAAEASSGDAVPWSELAFAHFERGEYGEAAVAYQRAVEIDDSEAVLWSALGEARAYASDRDPLPAPALAAFERALELDPSDPRARYFLAVKQDLDEDHEGAIASWLALLSDTPPGAPWERDLVRTIQQVGAIHDIAVEERLATVMEARAPSAMLPGTGQLAQAPGQSDLRGPTARQIVEASRLTPGEQRGMAEGMVAQLEERLEQEPDNLNGWVMLMRSRMTLGEPDRARQALDAAITANPANADELRAQARQLGIQ